MSDDSRIYGCPSRDSYIIIRPMLPGSDELRVSSEINLKYMEDCPKFTTHWACTCEDKLNHLYPFYPACFICDFSLPTPYGA